MTTTLDACFAEAEKAAHSDLSAKEKELEAGEKEHEDARVRLDAERRLEFYDELSNDVFATQAPNIMQSFLVHGEASSRIEAEALALAGRELDDLLDDDLSEEKEGGIMSEYDRILDILNKLQEEASSLESAIVHLTDSSSGLVDPSPNDFTPSLSPDDLQPSTSEVPQDAHSQLAPLFLATLPLLRARRANLVLARELVEGGKEGVRMRMWELSQGYSDEEEDGSDVANQDEYDADEGKSEADN